MIIKRALAILCLGMSSICIAQPALDIDTGVVSEKEAKVDHFEWGKLISYYQGTSYATKDALTAVAVINPKMEIHPPHKHYEEEYLMVLEGEGTWSVKGKTFAAKAGDILYAKPWDMHGITNTGDKPLKFIVFKWGYKPPVE